MIYGPDGKPINAAPVVGAPVLEDAPPVTAAEIPALRAPIDELLQTGAPMQTNCQIPLAVLVQLVATAVRYVELAETGEE